MSHRHPGAVYGHSRGAAPGSKQWFLQTEYRTTWSTVEWDRFCEHHIKGDRILQVCCGASGVGDLRIDRDAHVRGVNLVADMFRLPLPDRTFDTVLCDPPFRLTYPWRIRLQRELTRVAKERIIFKCTWPLRAAGWYLRKDLTVTILTHTCADISALQVLDRAPREGPLFPGPL